MYTCHIRLSPIAQTYSPSISSFMCNVLPANLPRGCC